MLRLVARRTALGATAITAATAARCATSEVSETHTLSSCLQQLLIFDVMRVAGWFARRSHDRDCADFAQVQRDTLRGRLEANRATSYGADHGFSRLLEATDVVDSFRRLHPLTMYDHFAPYVDRVAAGEANVLNAEPETLLAATSGTSGRRALLPNTATMSKTFFVRGILVVFDTLRRMQESAFQLQRNCKLTFAASWQEAPGGLRIGPNSSGPKDKGFDRLLPLYSTPMAGFEIANDEGAALYVHALFALRDRKLGMLEANFLALPYRLLQLIERDGERLAADIERGALDPGVAARLDRRTALAIDDALGAGDRRRAQEVREALAQVEGPGKGPTPGLMRRLWPQLHLILSNATGAFETYARQLRGGAAEGVPILSTILAASEGLIGVSLYPRDSGEAEYCLVPRAMFFEFLPIGAAADLRDADAREEPTAAHQTPGVASEPRTLLAHELAVGREYELVVTNLGGLYRYRLGDVVRVTGFHEHAPLVEFRHRQGQLLNVRGEKLSERQLTSAVATAFPERAVLEFSSAELVDRKAVPSYVVVVEAPSLSASELAAAARKLDDALGSENAAYATWRAKGAIGPVELQQVTPGAFDALRQQRLREGASPQQLKVSRVLRDPRHLDLLRDFGATARRR